MANLLDGLVFRNLPHVMEAIFDHLSRQDLHNMYLACPSWQPIIRDTMANSRFKRKTRFQLLSQWRVKPIREKRVEFKELPKEFKFDRGELIIRDTLVRIIDVGSLQTRSIEGYVPYPDPRGHFDCNQEFIVDVDSFATTLIRRNPLMVVFTLVQGHQDQHVGHISVVKIMEDIVVTVSTVLVHVYKINSHDELVIQKVIRCVNPVKSLFIDEEEIVFNYGHHYVSVCSGRELEESHTWRFRDPIDSMSFASPFMAIAHREPEIRNVTIWALVEGTMHTIRSVHIPLGVLQIKLTKDHLMMMSNVCYKVVRGMPVGAHGSRKCKVEVWSTRDLMLDFVCPIQTFYSRYSMSDANWLHLDYRHMAYSENTSIVCMDFWH